MILWMLWTIAVTSTIAAAGVVLERALVTRDRAARGVWLATLPAVFMLAGWAAWRTSRAGEPTALPPVLPGASPTPAASAGVDVLHWVQGVGADFLVRADAVAPWAWALTSAVVTLLLAGGLAVLRRRIGRWARAELDGEPVVLSENFGPALVGVLDPTIVLPRWVLGLNVSDRRLALRHEVEHREALDTLVLSFGMAAAAVMPWNPAIWFIARRLRQAVEVDCDRRVLRSGCGAAAYGALLIELSAASPRSGLSVAPMTQPASLLERRLTMMTRTMKRSSISGVTGAVLVAASLLIAACDSPPPSMTAPDTDELSATATAPIAGLLEGGEAVPLVYVDGIRVDRSVLASLDPDQIERVEIVKGAAAQSFGDDASAGVVQVFLKAGQDRLREQAPEPSDLSRAKLFVDGERVSSIEDISPEDVERMDVISAEGGDEVHVTLKRSASSGGA